MSLCMRGVVLKVKYPTFLFSSGRPRANMIDEVRADAHSVTVPSGGQAGPSARAERGLRTRTGLSSVIDVGLRLLDFLVEVICSTGAPARRH
jgi:hypothetical protein